MAPIPVMERWSNPPSTSGADGDLSLGFFPMFQGIIPLIWGFALKLFQNFESTIQPLTPIHSVFDGSHLNTYSLFYPCFYPIEDNYMLSPLQRTGTVATGMGMVHLDLQIWLFFIGVETKMGLSFVFYGGFSWIFCSLVISTNFAVVEAAGESLFRVIRFFCVVTLYKRKEDGLVAT
ncbi:hypothetical protein D8674_013118 [Pyrus ussuriensis x Pyrus communis]|uniref:Uncharacterized protein n=1 Tax=Pyrus ussuriensis x Pyrus communis TaxID=2448454 RepID=A0A5N5GNX3_9ROSA|nr:hypothetical protein D8674_013118 [Pyrus ussuriensis x Pyrus communis]